MAILGSFIKQPFDVLDYDIDYSQWLPAGDQLQTVHVTITPNTLISNGVAPHGTWVKIWLSGGVARVRYKITVDAVTTDGREKQDEFMISTKDY